MARRAGGGSARLGVVAIVGVVTVALSACGAKADLVQTVRAGALETSALHTAKVSASLSSDIGPLLGGVHYDGGFDFGARRAHFTFDPASFGAPAGVGTIDAIFDYSAGVVIYMHLPQLSQQLAGKTWLKLDLAAAIKASGANVDISKVLQGQSSDPTSGLRLLQGASKVTKAGSEVIRGVKTTHYAVIVDLDKAVQAAPAAAQDAMRQLVNLYTVKTQALDVWLDNQQRVRRYQQTIDMSTLKLPAAAKAANVLGNQLNVKLELYDFGSPVDVQVPPAGQVTDFAQLGALAGGATGSSTPRPAATGAVSPAKAGYLARANAICQVMNDKTQAIADPGTDPLKQATTFDQDVAITADALRQLRALAVPPGDAATVQAVFAAVETVLTDATQEAAALRAGDQTRAQAISTKLDADTTAANNAANAYGLTVCGS